ncbi:MAG: DUF5050 domain-containing protein, partial [Lachnospiraceae bacterium]
MRRGIVLICLLCAVLSFAACANGVTEQEYTHENVITDRSEQPTEEAVVTEKPKTTKSATPTKNPWISEPDWVEKPSEPAKEFFPGALTGEECEVGALSGNMTSFGYVCENDGYLYYSDKSNDETLLCKESIYGNGSGKQILADEETQCLAINVLGDDVYYAAGGKIKRVHKDGGKPVVLWDKGVSGIAVTKEKIFFVHSGIYSMNLDGSNVTLLTTRGAVKGDVSEIASITVYRDYVIYLAYRDDFSLYAIKKDGTEEYLIQKGVSWPSVASDCVYYPLREDALEYHPEFSMEDLGKIVELSLLTGKKRIVTGEAGLHSQVVGDRLYYNNNFHAIRCA